MARKDNIDIFFSPRHHLPLGMQVPCVLTIHDVVWKRFPQTMKAAGRLLEAMLMHKSIAKASAVISVSEATKNDIELFFPGANTNVSVIYEASALHPEGNRQSVESPYILFVGSFEPRKNIHRLIVAYSRMIREDHLDIDLVLAGGGGWKLDVQALLDEAELAGRIKVVRVGSDDELRSLYAGCSFLALPSLYEGFGLPIVEAMSFGKPVLVGNNSAMPEIAGLAAILVDAKDTDDVRAGLRALSSDESLRSRLGELAATRAQNFSWQKASVETAAVFKMVIANTSLN